MRQMPSGKTIIACAMKKEAKGLRKHLGDEYAVVVTGMGPDRTLANLEQVFESAKPSVMVFTGMAGQLDPRVELGQFVFPETWKFESGTEFNVEPFVRNYLRGLGWDISGTGVTVRSPVARKQHRRRLYEKSGAKVCDMESAAAMMIAKAYGVKCVAPKVVSDTAKSGMLALYRYFDRNVEILAERIKELANHLEQCATSKQL